MEAIDLGSPNVPQAVVAKYLERFDGSERLA